MSTRKIRKEEAAERRKLRVNADYDYKLITCILFLAGFGLIVLYSASYYKEGLSVMGKQALFTGIGLVGMFIVAEIDYHKLKAWALTLYVLAIISVCLVKTPLGKSVNGATRWLNFRVFTIQPAEFMKVGLILAMAAVISAYWKRLRRWQINIVLIIMMLLPSALVLVLTNNMSTAIILGVIAYGMIYISHPEDRWWLLVALVGLLLVCVLIVWIVYFKEYDINENFRYTRIRIWFDPFNEAYANSLQVREGLYGIASGGLFGRGLGNSILKQGFLPEPYNDMIFAVLCEEMGLFGAVMVLYLFFYLIVRIFRIGMSAPDKFGFLICMGVMLHIASQVILNVLVVTNTIMNTGITLCFFSGGGTSLLFLYVEIGLVLSVAKRIQNLK